MSVAIRPFELCGDRVWLGTSGGSAADSDPGRALEEALVNARSRAAATGSRVVVDGGRSRACGMQGDAPRRRRGNDAR